MFDLQVKGNGRKASRNRKTGPIPVSMSTVSTCPTSCPLREKGCYAKYSYAGFFWSKLNRGERGKPWNGFLEDVRDLAEGQLWRHNIAGDLAGNGDAIDGPAMFDLLRANGSSRGFTYTHKPVTGRKQVVEDNRLLVFIANRHGFTVNLSADSLSEADQLADLAIGPVVTLLPSGEMRKRLQTPEGRSVTRCPAEYTDLTCETCGLCARSDRKSIVGFTVHGTGKNFANAIAKGERS